MKEISSNNGVSETKEAAPSKEVEKDYITDDDISSDDYDTRSETSETEDLSMDDTEQMEDLDGNAAHLPKNHGEWEGERGNSKWVPDDDYVPKQMNPEGSSWADLKQEYDFDGVEFNNNSPDFSGFAKGEVQIDDFGDTRYKNFAQADIKEAEKRGCQPEDVANWRKEHDYTWHELNDCSTMQKVPSVIHNNVPHSGGISEFKNENKDTMEEF